MCLISIDLSYLAQFQHQQPYSYPYQYSTQPVMPPYGFPVAGLQPHSHPVSNVPQPPTHPSPPITFPPEIAALIVQQQKPQQKSAHPPPYHSPQLHVHMRQQEAAPVFVGSASSDTQSTIGDSQAQQPEEKVQTELVTAPSLPSENFESKVHTEHGDQAIEHAGTDSHAEAIVAADEPSKVEQTLVTAMPTSTFPEGKPEHFRARKPRKGNSSRREVVMQLST